MLLQQLIEAKNGTPRVIVLKEMLFLVENKRDTEWKLDPAPSDKVVSSLHKGQLLLFYRQDRGMSEYYHQKTDNTIEREKVAFYPTDFEKLKTALRIVLKF